MTFSPTPDPDLNVVLQTLVNSVQTILGKNFVGAYLQGSFATGDFDEYSDVDWLVVINHSLNSAELTALQAMHPRIHDLDCPWAKHLEGSYFPLELLNQRAADCEKLHYLDNGSRQLVPSTHDNTLVVRWVTREQGITLAGPEPSGLIDPIPADALQQEVLQTMHDWGHEILNGQYKIENRWAQPFAALSYGRMLHTLDTGQIHSKPAAVRWAKTNLDGRWAELLERAWQERPFPTQKANQLANPDERALTLAFIRYALAMSEKQASL